MGFCPAWCPLRTWFLLGSGRELAREPARGGGCTEAYRGHP
jgi:hypothetical protein